MKIQIRYHGDMQPLEKLPNGDWIDLRAAETVTLRQGEYRAVSLGVSMKLPAGYEAHVAPRSSTFKRWGVLMVNGVGVIDESYCGDGDVWAFPAYAVRDTVIEKGDRICQFRIFEVQPAVEFEECEALSDVDRGGFGSTGVK